MIVSSPVNETDPVPCPLRVSVVVPTEGRVEDLRVLIASLRASWQDYAARTGESRPSSEIVEFIMVDSTNPVHTPTLFDAWDPGWMRVVPEGRNVRHKRNRGVQEARGEWIAFIDSDCVATPAYLGAILDATRTANHDAFAGKVTFAGDENFIWRVISATQLVTPETQTDATGEVAWCATANLIVRRSLFVAAGGFDETLPFRLGGDDVDFGLRLRRRGKALRVLSSAAVIHPKKPWSKLKAISSRAWRWGKVEYHLSHRHGELVKKMPPAFHANLLLITVAFIAVVCWTGKAVLLGLVPVWALFASLTSVYLTGRNSPVPYLYRYLGGLLQQYYRLGTIREYLGHGDPRCFWEGLILEAQLDWFFPGEPLDSWSQLAATAFVTVLGILVLHI